MYYASDIWQNIVCPLLVQISEKKSVVKSLKGNDKNGEEAGIWTRIFITPVYFYILLFIFSVFFPP